MGRPFDAASTGVFTMFDTGRSKRTVVVYSFCLYDLDSRTMRQLPYKLPRPAIEATKGAELLEATAQEVALGALDAQGRYRRVATGWGELA
jgi:hypothetical protein